MRIFILLVATGGGTGLSPIAPGTAGSALAVGLFAALAYACASAGWPGDAPQGSLVLASATLLVSGLGVWASGRAEQILGTKDDGRITIDEVAGMWLSLLTLPARIEVFVCGFVLFRIFDIWKPPPARRCESWGGGLGVMGDDWVAGLYANLAGQLLWRILFPGGLW